MSSGVEFPERIYRILNILVENTLRFRIQNALRFRMLCAFNDSWWRGRGLGFGVWGLGLRDWVLQFGFGEWLLAVGVLGEG